ncbi:hypothetical protein BB31_38330 [Amycolatopsis lurida NRRL 2430]|uniref:Uncharacterized protein n=1 Tax=Amycolatopsis lurida NRRL 2430 TaxID=1460371 RepID=A0A2P2FGX9_AMYLU|nr:hypothetical protein [Amycolatopsis lurida]KFU75974.1 hypothetical protein BB31_38330 [Amycolatopsis lurida NRRL 2430]
MPIIGSPASGVRVAVCSSSHCASSTRTTSGVWTRKSANTAVAIFATVSGVGVLSPSRAPSGR